jgi:GT2 family glycosyltransferase
MTSHLPLVSVCVANYNGMEVIDECLRSALSQQGDIALEILVHDDASTDGSVAYIREHYPTARVIESESNVGFCVANNRMAAQASGTYLLLLNNDAALYRDALEALLAESIRLDRPAILTLPQFDAASGELIDRGCLLDPFFNPVPNLDPARVEVAMVIGACLWIPRPLWIELGGFPAWFGSIAEDMYLCCRARLAGYTVRTLPASGYRHWQGKSFGGNRIKEGRLATTFRRRALSERNKTHVLILTCPLPLLLVILPLHLGLINLEGLLVAALKWDARVWRTIYGPLIPELWRARRKLSHLRKQVQNGRRTSMVRWLRVFKVFPYKIRMLLKHGLPLLR